MTSRITRVIGAFAAVILVATVEPAAAQPTEGFAPPNVGGGFAPSSTVEAFDQAHFGSSMNGPTGIQPADPIIAEARRRGLVAGLNVALELFIDRPRDLLLVGIIGNIDNNDVVSGHTQ